MTDGGLNRCKHIRQMPNRQLKQCRRTATADGYCTPHHPDYTDPSTRAYLAQMDAEDASTPPLAHLTTIAQVTA